MTLFVNNKQFEFSNKENIQSVLQHLQLKDAKGIAVAVNNHVIVRSDWEKYFIQPNDRVTIIKATQGG